MCTVHGQTLCVIEILCMLVHVSTIMSISVYMSTQLLSVFMYTHKYKSSAGTEQTTWRAWIPHSRMLAQTRMYMITYSHVWIDILWIYETCANIMHCCKYIYIYKQYIRIFVRTQWICFGMFIDWLMDIYICTYYIAFVCTPTMYDLAWTCIHMHFQFLRASGWCSRTKTVTSRGPFAKSNSSLSDRSQQPHGPCISMHIMHEYKTLMHIMHILCT